MTEHNWKPGDVAMVACFDDGCEKAEHPAMRARSGSWWLIDQGTYLTKVKPLRPLVVIDPEDREQVERLTEAFATNDGRHSDPIGDMQAALRQFAAPTPPKPDEPQGLGAVVEDDRGRKWVRDLQHTETSPWLHSTRRADPKRRPYDDISVVRVLSEGVTA